MEEVEIKWCGRHCLRNINEDQSNDWQGDKMDERVKDWIANDSIPSC